VLLGNGSERRRLLDPATDWQRRGHGLVHIFHTALLTDSSHLVVTITA
jgi:hypothetical protein